MSARIALVDWDGTLRKDFTIRTWVKFLVNHGLFSQKAFEDIEGVFALRFKESISHDETSRRTNIVYAHYLKGLNKAKISEMASSFFEEDVQYLCPFSLKLLSWLTRNNIQIVVISGAPKEIIQQYESMFLIAQIHGLEIQARNGIFTGDILKSCGMSQEKSNIVKEILTSKTHKIAFAAGNSSSDLPMLDAAPVCIVVDNNNLKVKGQHLHISCDDTNIDEILAFLDNSLV